MVGPIALPRAKNRREVMRSCAADEARSFPDDQMVSDAPCPSLLCRGRLQCHSLARRPRQRGHCGRPRTAAGTRLWRRKHRYGWRVKHYDAICTFQCLTDEHIPPQHTACGFFMSTRSRSPTSSGPHRRVMRSHRTDGRLGGLVGCARVEEHRRDRLSQSARICEIHQDAPSTYEVAVD